MKNIVILYTTLYRGGGPKFARAAETMKREKMAEFPDCQVFCRAVERKAEFLKALTDIEGEILELHFIGHSGVYGIMFGTDKWPEQFSPHEWREMKINFAPGARAYFHACRSGRWFAAFIARTLNVRAYGHHWYTTVSSSKDRFVPESLGGRDQDIYIIACPGKKSHGLTGSAVKYSGFALASKMLEFEPGGPEIDTTYDSVAALYDETFSDIGVRKDEWNWLMKSREALEGKDVLDLGCGNGAFLNKLAPMIKSGTGCDISREMLAKARLRCQNNTNLKFEPIDGPKLPFADNSFDTVMSVLSFRYLDWDPILSEILRVLRPGGEILVVDMVASPVKWKELPKFTVDKVKQVGQRFANRQYFRSLSTMVRDARWKKMLQYNPIRAEHELRWYLESRIPGRKVEVINVGWSSRIMAFRSGPVEQKTIPQMQFP